MDLKLTERDKKLLKILAVVVLVLGVGAGICYPLLTKGNKLQKSVSEARDLKAENEQKVTELPVLKKTLEAANANIAAKQNSFFPMLQSMQIDQMLTETALAQGISMSNLNITMPVAGTNSTLVDYAAMISAQNTQDTGASQEEPSYDGMYTASVDLAMTGSQASIQAVLDNLVAQEPKMRLTGLTWQKPSSTADYSVAATLDIYMYESTEQYITEQAEKAAEEAAANAGTDTTEATAE